MKDTKRYHIVLILVISILIQALMPQDIRRGTVVYIKAATPENVYELDSENKDAQGIVYTLNQDKFSASVADNRAYKGTGIITLPSYVKKDGRIYIVNDISSDAFYGNSKVFELTIPDTVLRVGTGALGCAYLDTLYIGAGVRDIDLTDANGLVSISCSDDSKHFHSVDGVLYDKSMTRLIRYPAERKVSEFTIPDTVTSLEVSAFACADISRINLPPSLRRLSSHAFYKSSIEGFDLSYVSYIDSYALSDTKMKWIRLKKGVVINGGENLNSVGLKFLYLPDHTKVTSDHVIPATSNVECFVTGDDVFADASGGTVLDSIRKNADTYSIGRDNIGLSARDGDTKSCAEGEHKYDYQSIYASSGAKLSGDVCSVCGHIGTAKVSLDTDQASFTQYDPSYVERELDSANTDSCGITYTLKITDTDRLAYVKSINLNDSVKTSKTLIIPDIVIKDGVRYPVRGVQKGSLTGQASTRYIKEISLPAFYDAGGQSENVCEVFSDIPLLSTIDVSDDNGSYADVDGVLYSADKSVLYKYPPAKTDASFVVDDACKIVYDDALNGAAFETIDLKNIDRISGSGTICSGCTNLKNISAEGQLRSSNGVSQKTTIPSAKLESIYITGDGLEPTNLDTSMDMSCVKYIYLGESVQVTNLNLTRVVVYAHLPDGIEINKTPDGDSYSAYIPSSVTDIAKTLGSLGVRISAISGEPDSTAQSYAKTQGISFTDMEIHIHSWHEKTIYNSGEVTITGYVCDECGMVKDMEYNGGSVSTSGSGINRDPSPAVSSPASDTPVATISTTPSFSASPSATTTPTPTASLKPTATVVLSQSPGITPSATAHHTQTPPAQSGYILSAIPDTTATPSYQEQLPDVTGLPPAPTLSQEPVAYQTQEPTSDKPDDTTKADVTKSPFNPDSSALPIYDPSSLRVEGLVTKTKDNRTVLLSWKKQAHATYYQIYRSVRKESGYQAIAYLDSSSYRYTDKTVKPDKKYYYRVSCYAGVLSDAVSMSVNGMISPGISVTKKSKKNIRTLTIKLKKYAGKYIIVQVKKGKGKWKKIKLTNNKIKSYKGKKIRLRLLLKKKLLHIRIRTYKIKKGKKIYSLWSKTKKVKV